MFGRLWAQLWNKVKFDAYSELCLAKQMFVQLRMGFRHSLSLPLSLEISVMPSLTRTLCIWVVTWLITIYIVLLWLQLKTALICWIIITSQTILPFSDFWHGVCHGVVEQVLLECWPWTQVAYKLIHSPASLNLQAVIPETGKVQIPCQHCHSENHTVVTCASQGKKGCSFTLSCDTL